MMCFNKLQDLFGESVRSVGRGLDKARQALGWGLIWGCLATVIK